MHVNSIVHIVAICSKQELWSQGKPLLANGSETTFISRQQLDKHVPTATDATIEVIVFPTWSMQRGYKDN
jgi:hypothetical protein